MKVALERVARSRPKAMGFKSIVSAVPPQRVKCKIVEKLVAAKRLARSRLTVFETGSSAIPNKPRRE